MNPFLKKSPCQVLGSGIVIVALSWFSLGCEDGSRARENDSGQNTLSSKDEPATAGSGDVSPKTGKSADHKKVEIGRNVVLEVQGEKRRVIVQAEVCLREGMLEHLMCRYEGQGDKRRGTKEHEAILTAEVDARDIHKALILAKATPGTTVRYKDDGTVVPPTGTKIKVTLTYKDKDKTVTVPGRDWVRDLKTKKSLDVDWVFAGSHLVENPLEKDKPPFYMANGGDVICVSNFVEAMLDLPINSSKNNAELEFEAFTERIPSVGTAVTVILEPVLEAKKDKVPSKERQENQKEKKTKGTTSP